MYDGFRIFTLMNEPINPFSLSSYAGPETFCDRETETKRMVTNAVNGVNTTLLSTRRMGKTGLIYHVFHQLRKSRKAECVYADIFATRDLRGLTNQLAGAIMKSFPEHKTLGKKFMILLKALRPVISFNALSGEPEVSLDFAQPKQFEQSLAGLLEFLENQPIRIVVAFDEFQQIQTYPETNIEALLRTLIQPLKNVQFIFSGSNEHMLAEMFGSAKRPFFSSTQPVHLDAIAADKYSAFIQKLFGDSKRKIHPDAVEFIVYWTRLHTYYTQAVCNRLYSTGAKDITLEFVRQQCNGLLKDQEGVFVQYRNLLTAVQWNLLRAIAGEDKVYQPSAGAFISKYQIGAPANIQRGIEALMNKEMIFRTRDERGEYYRVSDCFLARWLEGQ